MASILNGGSGKRSVVGMTDKQYLADVFLPGVTDYEWTLLSIMGVGLRITSVVSGIVAIREESAYPLHPEHPLNPASRY